MSKLEAKKKVLDAATIAAIAKHAGKFKDAHDKKLRSYQLPVRAHTSPLAKAAIIVSLVTSTVTFGVVVAGAVHKAAYKKNPDYRKKADEKSLWVESKVEEAKNEAGDAYDRAKVKVDEVADKAKDQANDVAKAAAKKKD